MRGGSGRGARPATGARVPGLTVAAVLLAAGVAHAQRLPASPPLPPEHWAPAVLERLAAAGLLHGVWMPGTRPVPAAVAEAAFDTAAARTEATGSPLAAFAVSASERLAAELDPDGPRPTAWVAASTGVMENDVPTAALSGDGSIVNSSWKRIRPGERKQLPVRSCLRVPLRVSSPPWSNEPTPSRARSADSSGIGDRCAG